MKKIALLPLLVGVPVIAAALALSPAQAKSLARPGAQPDSQPATEPLHAVPPPPGEHHQWLEQLVGTWSFEATMGPEGSQMECSGTDTVRSIGGRWIVSDVHNTMGGMGEMHAVFTLGYNPETGKYQATWIDSMTDFLWVYDGTLDTTGKVLTLEAEGPNMMDPAGGAARYRDVIELKSPDHRTQNSFAQVDGQWVQFASADYRRTE